MLFVGKDSSFKLKIGEGNPLFLALTEKNLCVVINVLTDVNG